jgi:hypothetical protein
LRVPANFAQYYSLPFRLKRFFFSSLTFISPFHISNSIYNVSQVPPDRAGRFPAGFRR